MRESLTQGNSSQSHHRLPEGEKSDNPYVTLEYETKPQASKKPRAVVLKPVNTPSCFAEVERLQILKEEAEKEAAD